MASLQFDNPSSRSMYALLSANTISQLGNTFSFLAIPWLVLTTTGGAEKTGLVVAAGTLPFILVGIFGGVFVDRLGYKLTSVVSDVLSGASVALIPLLDATIGLEFWQLLVLVFMGAFFDGPGMTARQALFPELVRGTGLSLDRANTQYSLTRRIASTLGQPVAGIAIGLMGPLALLTFNAATFAVSALITLLLVPSPQLENFKEASVGFRGYVRDVRDGLVFFTRDRLLLMLFVVLAAGTLLVEPIYPVLLPLYANEVLGSATRLGFIFGALGAGSIIGNFVFLAIGERLSRGTILLGGFAIRALALSVMAFEPTWWMIAIAVFIGAVALEPVNPMSMSIFQERVPSGMRGRVFGAQAAVIGGVAPIGVVGYGFVVSAIGLQQTLYLFVVMHLALAVACCCIPTLRSIARPDSANAYA